MDGVTRRQMETIGFGPRFCNSDSAARASISSGSSHPPVIDPQLLRARKFGCDMTWKRENERERNKSDWSESGDKEVFTASILTHYLFHII